MPINYAKYPKNWKSEIRPRILHRANNRCECCGIQNNTIVSAIKTHQQKTVWVFQTYSQWIREGCPKRVRVVLTIAHLDHDEENHDVSDDRLKAMCQLCHLRYDTAEKKRRRKENIPDPRSGETPFFQSWQKYKFSNDYARAYKALREKGVQQPYLDNILHGAFAAGWNYEPTL